MIKNKTFKLLHKNKILIKMFTCLEKGKDVFEKNKYICEKNHTFCAYQNDKLFCNQCFLNSLLSVFTELKIEALISDNLITFTKNNEINFYVGKENFMVEKDNFIKIIIKDEIKEIKNLKDKLWDCIIAGKDAIIEKDKLFKHYCEHTTVINEENDGTGSLYKYASPPYPFGKKLAVGYLRVSTSMQANEGISLEAQESEIFKYAELNNYFLKTIYIDRGISGGKIEKRLAMQELINTVEKEEGLVVITYSISRIARRVKDLLDIVECIQKNKGNFITLDLNLDFTSSTGKFVLTVMGSQAELERNITSERVKSVLSHLKSQGKLKNKPRFGWSVNPEKNSEKLYIRNEEEQEIIKKIRDLRYKNKHLNITKFTKLINEKIPPPRKSKTWHRPNLKEMMVREGIWEDEKKDEKKEEE